MWTFGLWGGNQVLDVHILDAESGYTYVVIFFLKKEEKKSCLYCVLKKERRKAAPAK